MQGKASNSVRNLREMSQNGSGMGSSRSQASTAPSSGARSQRSVQSARGPRNSDSRGSRGYGSPAMRYDPPSRRSSQMSSPMSETFVPSRTPPGAEMSRPDRWSRTPSDNNLDVAQYQTMMRTRGLESPGSARGSALGSARGYRSEGDLRSEASQSPSRRESRGPSSSVTSSEYSGASTPVAGRTWGRTARTFGAGVGKQHYPMKSHFGEGMVADNDGPGLHGRHIDDDLQSGVERFVGHGKRFLGGEISHMKGPIPQFESVPGLHGRPKGEDFEGGMCRLIGHGLKKYDRTTHHRHHISDDIESEPGLHGHTRDFDFKDGMPWYIGHGKRRLAPNYNAETHKPQPNKLAGADGNYCISNFRAAGMSTRDIALSELTRDPTRRDTHQDRRFLERKGAAREVRRDQQDQIVDCFA